MDDDNDDEAGWGLASGEKEAKEDIFWDQKGVPFASESTYLIVDSTACDAVFITTSVFLFSSLSDYFLGELIRTLASEK